MKPNCLTLTDLQIGYGQHALSSPLNLELPQGATLGIIGTNGAGKSTLMKTLLGMVAPFKGRYQWGSGSVFGYVPQENQIDDLFPFTVLDLFKMGKFPKLPRFQSRSRGLSQELQSGLRELEIEHLQDQLFRDLSGGQKQRVLLGRALIANPTVLLLDEPFTALDYSYRERFWNILRSWQNRSGLTLILIEHDLNRVINNIDSAILLGPHQSIVGPRNLLINPELLSQTYEAPLHVHEEDGKFQIHFL